MDFVGQNLSLDFILGVIRSHLRVLGSVMPRSNLFIGLFPQIKKNDGRNTHYIKFSL